MSSSAQEAPSLRYLASDGFQTDVQTFAAIQKRFLHPAISLTMMLLSLFIPPLFHVFLTL
jgi:hypothetical protein